MSKLSDVPFHIVELCQPTKCQKLEDIRAVCTEFFELKDHAHFLAICADGEAIDYALYAFSSQDVSPEIGPVFLECVFRGHGYAGCLREMRHTYFNPDEDDSVGYCFYLPIDAMIEALTYLKKYFD